MRKKGRLALPAALVAALAFVAWSLFASHQHAIQLGDEPTDARGPGLAARPDRRNVFVRVGDWLRAMFESEAESEPKTLAFVDRPAAGPPGTLEVLVRRENGSAVAGARVSLLAPVRGVTPSLVTTTDAGIALFASLPSALGYVVRVAGADGESGTKEAAVVARTTTRADVVFARPSIEGIVVDAKTKEPVSAARVEAFHVTSGWDMNFGIDPRPYTLVAITDASGRFTIPTAERRSVCVTARASDGRVGFLDSDELGGLRIPVAATVSLTGIVEDEDGQPLAGVRVRAGTRLHALRDGGVVVTDVHGSFRVDGIEAGSVVSIVVGSELEGPVAWSWSDRTPMPVHVVLPRRTGLVARVIDDGSGEPVAGVVVRTTSYSEDRRSSDARAVTDRNGIARISVLPALVESLDVRADGYPRAEYDEFGQSLVLEDPGALAIALERGESRAITIRLRRGVAVTGRVVLPSGEPAVGALVGCHDGQPVRADADGRFRIEGVLPVFAKRPDASFVSAILAPYGSATLDLPPIQHREAIDVATMTLTPAGALRGRVVDGVGSPLAGASVGDATTDENGRFEVVGVPVGTPMTLRVDAEGFVARRIKLGDVVHSGEIRVVPPIVLTRARATDLRVEIRVVDPAGAPVGGAAVRFDDPPKFATTDPDGRATLDGIEGSRVHIRTRDGARFRIYVRARNDEEPVEVVLVETRTLEGTVTDESGAPLAGVSVRARSLRKGSRGRKAADEPEDATTGADGRFRIVGIAGPRAAVSASAKGFVDASVEIDDLSQPVTLDLRRFGERDRERLREIARETARLLRSIASATDADAADEIREKIDELEAEASRLRGG